MAFGSYRSPSTVASDGVYQLFRGGIYGALWGMVTPFHAPGSLGAIKEAKSGIFKPAAPFSSLTSIGHNAAIFGSIMGVQRFSSKSLELIRGKEDFYNECFGFGVTYKYYKSFLGSTDGKLLRHNRLIGAAFVGTLLYANLIV